MPDFEHLDWPALDRLRGTFLADAAGRATPYWNNQETLAAYDVTYGERIGWKWDALLHELALRVWTPPAGSLLVDWGCGSGVAGRRVLAAFGPAHFSGLHLHDHSPEAVTFATARARETFPALPLLDSPAFRLSTAPFTLVVSHVLNELPADARANLLELAGRASAVIWVEPGTHADSRALAAVRDGFRTTHRIVAPCTHRESCPLFIEANARDWCHFFAHPPAGVQNDASWVRFAFRAGIDLRSQAYSCLVLDRLSTPALPASADGMKSVRVLGRPEVFKPYARLLACASDGMHFVELSKRTDPVLVKRLAKDPPLPLYDLAHEGSRVISLVPLFSGKNAEADSTED
ncbi:MAG: hypothetical protein RIQ79_2151 [Verrucomicrobiota bacterium]|jgi:hypothetical protein